MTPFDQNEDPVTTISNHQYESNSLPVKTSKTVISGHQKLQTTNLVNMKSPDQLDYNSGERYSHIPNKT